MNTIEITGNLGADPELRVTDNGPVASFSLANTPRLRDGSQGNTTWVTIQVWDDLANIVAESLKKGSFVSVSGRLVQQSWTDKETGAKRTRHVIRAASVWKPLTERRKSESVTDEQDPLFYA